MRLLVFALALLSAAYVAAPIDARAKHVEREAIRMAVATPALTKGHPFGPYLGGSIPAALYDGLTQLTLSGRLMPAIASAWKAVDETAWQFEIRGDVRLQDGRLITTEMIVAEIDYLLRPENRHFWVAEQLKTIVSARMLAPRQMLISTRVPDPLLPQKLSLLRVIDLSEWHARGDLDFAEHPNGSGPYRVLRWGPNATRIQLEPVPHAWRAVKGMRPVEIRVLPDATRRGQSLLSGEVDLATNLDPDMIPVLQAQGLQHLQLPNPIWIVMAYRNGGAKNPLADVRVRQALNHAVNKELIANELLHLPHGTVPFPGTVLGFDAAEAGFQYDLARAKRLLSEAGYADGLRLRVAVWTGQAPGDSSIFQQVAADLRKAGVTLDLVHIAFTEFSRRLDLGEWGPDIDAISRTWSSRMLMDPLPALEAYSCNVQRKPIFCDAVFDKAVERLRYVMSPDVRETAIRAGMEAVLARAPALFIAPYSDVVGMSHSISGYSVRSDGVELEKLMFVP